MIVSPARTVVADNSARAALRIQEMTMRRETRKRRSMTRAPFCGGPTRGSRPWTHVAMRRSRCYCSLMGKSSIAKHLHAGAGSIAARELGRRVRERRLAIGMTQSELAAPLTRGFVSAVEQGHALPSLGALWLFATRLRIRVGDLVDGVNGVGTPKYTVSHDQRTFCSSCRRRHHPATTSRRR